MIRTLLGYAETIKRQKQGVMMSEEALGSVGEHSSLNDDPGISLTDLVQSEVDPIAETNNNVHGQSGF